MEMTRKLAIPLLALLMLPSTLALGLSYEYMEGNKLELAPGENYYFKLILQNEDDRAVTVEISLDSPLAKLVGGNRVTIPAATFDKFVYFNITVPASAQVGDQLSIPYTVVPVVEEKGQVTFGVKYDRQVQVLVTEPEGGRGMLAAPADVDEVVREDNSYLLLIALLVLAIIVVAFGIYRRRKSEKH